MLLPFIILAYKLLPKIVTVISFSLIVAIFFALNLALIIEKDIGAIPFFNQNPSEKYFDPDFRFFSEIFVKPWYHFNSYFAGVIISMVYMKFL